ncbi:MAG: hypothetical protein R3F17_08940 [Planctomycetota bacterium]
MTPPRCSGTSVGSDRTNVLYLAAHPDDENTRLIAYLSKFADVDVSYLSLTRGDGGQNLIGPEIGADLGIIRTRNCSPRGA